VLAAILTVVAYDMSDWRTFTAELRAPKSDVAVLLVTFALTVLADLTVAIEVGIVLAAFLFMRRMAEVTQVVVYRGEGERLDDDGENDPDGVARRSIPKGVEVYEIDGPFFFGAAETFKARWPGGQPAWILIVRLRHVPAIDSTGLHALADLHGVAAGPDRAPPVRRPCPAARCHGAPRPARRPRRRSPVRHARRGARHRPRRARRRGRGAACLSAP
jgi:MFS superfamily sulfate permease-like transporter